MDGGEKIKEGGGRARGKRSEGKATWPGRKQVYRYDGPDGRMAGDIVTLEGDALDGEALLQPVMQGGRRLGPAAPLADLRVRAAVQLARLPNALRRLTPRGAYPVEI